MATTQVELAEVDDTRTYSLEEKQALTENLLALTAAVHSGKFREAPLTVALLCDLHGRLFQGVRDHAGRYRRVGFGQEYLTFGPNRSTQRSHVLAELEDLVGEAKRCFRSFDSNNEDPNYELGALSVALLLHAKLIKIHPFEDGNGRTGRLLLDLVLIRLGIEPVPFDVPKEEYLETLNRFYAEHDIEPLLALYLRCYAMFAASD